MSCLEDMLLRSHGSSGSDQSALITAYEAEQLIQQLRVTSIEQVGDAKFLQQHDAVQKLNLQAHWNAQNHTSEFVLDLLVSLDKLSLLVQELLVIEAWKERLLPLLHQHLAAHVDSSIAYLVLYHEAAVANLLEVMLFHRHACEAVNEDSLLELADWAMRKLAYLNSTAHNHVAAKERSLQDTLALRPDQELHDKVAETDFAAATCGLTILRYITDYLPQLPLGLMGRLLCGHDAVMALLPLVDSPPWVRTRKDGKLEKFIGGKWQGVPPSDRLQITQLDGQVWLSLVNLLVEPACRAKYEIDDYRKGCLLRLQRHLHELLLDQLPVLRQLARVLDEISLGVDGGTAAAAAAAAAAAGGGGSSAAAAASARLIIEQVPVLREAILRGRDWQAIATRQREQQFGAPGKALARSRLDSFMQSFELLCQMEEQQAQQGGTAAAAAAATGSAAGVGGAGRTAGSPDEAAVHAAAVRVVCSRQVHAGGLWEHWCEFRAAIDACRPADAVTISTDGAAGGGKPARSSSSGGSGGSGGSGAGVIHGRRYRLAPMHADGTRALPTKGKVAVHFMGAVAEALLQLPEVPLRCAEAAGEAGAPAALWLTAGLLAADGFALQLRLRRADKPTERNRVDGGWFAYQPVGGAITVLAPRGTPGGGGGGAGGSKGVCGGATAAGARAGAASKSRGCAITVLSSSSTGATTKAPPVICSSTSAPAADTSALKP